jgi:hypothetical protein
VFLFQASVTKPRSKPDARRIARTGFFQSILLTVRGRSAATWRDGGIECADRRRYDRLVTACQEMQTEPLRAAAERLCRSRFGVTLMDGSW